MPGPARDTSSEIHSVTVYRDRAEMNRSVRVRVEAGQNEIVPLTGLPACTEKNSIGLGLSVCGLSNTLIRDIDIDM